MTEHNDDVDWKDVLFIVGAQTTPEGDMLPGSFTAFPRTTKPEDAIRVVMEKIADDLLELEVPKSVGSMAFAPIRTWEEFAELPIDAEIKLKALITSSVKELLETLVSSKQILEIATVAWLHHCEDHD